MKYSWFFQRVEWSISADETFETLFYIHFAFNLSYFSTYNS